MASVLIAPVLLIGVAAISESQETRTPAGAASSSPASETRAPDSHTPISGARAAVTAKAKELSAKDPATAAAAAYWLGEQGSAAAEAIPQLTAVLGDNRPVNATRYRKHPAQRAPRSEVSSPGEEAAAALAKIGEPAVEALISVLKTNPSPVARQNAAWALGVIQDRHKSSGSEGL